MEKTRVKLRAFRPAADVEDLLEAYYGQLRKWGTILARGDRGMAQEIVHDLCLYLTLAKPDLRRIENLDGYLYTSLRNLYLSTLARASREAMQFLSIADYDSVQFALSAGSADGLLEHQNDLRRICSYALWRKDSSKSASYFILHFFHGYGRQETARIARLPIAAIYNKLKIARAEVKTHLEQSGKLRIAAREMPPEPELRVSPVSSAEIFNELRRAIFEALHSACLPEDALLEHYRPSNPKPIPCGLLSHIVSCRRCLASIDRHLELPNGQDREPPDEIWPSADRDGAESAANDSKSFRALMRTVHWERRKFYDHRPRTLSIAVNGHIKALHDVQSERSTLASRIEDPTAAQFIEVFTDQRIRLALLPVGEQPPDGPHCNTQRVELSDDRWLELTLSFDGLGLHSEVTYFDPALAAAFVEAEENEESPTGAFGSQPELVRPEAIQAAAHSVFTKIKDSLHALTPRSAFAWTMVLALLLATAGYFGYRAMQPQLDARQILQRSVAVESAALNGFDEHQILQLDAAVGDGQAAWHGTVDVWKESNDGRTMRRLYDGQHRLIAAAWRESDGRAGSSSGGGRDNLSPSDRAMVASAVWQQDVSARGFETLATGSMRVRSTVSDYELTSVDTRNNPLHLVSATLVLNRHFQAVGEILRLSNGSGVREVRFVQADYERRPPASVPNAVFDPAEPAGQSSSQTGMSPLDRSGRPVFESNVQLARLQIAVLYELNKLAADTGEPIEVRRTAAGHILVAGTVADESRRREIRTGLETLPDRQLLDIHLASQRDLRAPAAALPASIKATTVYDVAQREAPAYTVIRNYFSSKGLSSEASDAAAGQFSQRALGHAQRALQHAYALDRLGTAFTADELQAVGPAAERQWADMAVRHASGLENELQQLDEQLLQIEPAGEQPSTAAMNLPAIDSPANFARTAGELLSQMQTLNRSIGIAFTSGATGKAMQNPESILAGAIRSIPLENTAQLVSFASRLSDSENAANSPAGPSEP